MEPKFNLKPTVIVVFIIVFILLLIMLIVSLNKKGGGEVSPTPVPTPTTLIPQISSTPEEEPTLIPIQDKTGVKEEIFPSITQSLIDQKQALRQKTPLIDKDFRIDFDYGEDKFVVTLNNPKDNTRSIFETWLQKNYPAIAIDRFIIN